MAITDAAHSGNGRRAIRIIAIRICTSIGSAPYGLVSSGQCWMAWRHSVWLPVTGFVIDTFVVHPRRGHRDRSSAGRHVPLLVIPVAHTGPVPVLVEDVSGTARHTRRPRPATPTTASATPVADQLIQQRTDHRRRRLLRILLSNYLEHGRTFPTGVGASALLDGLQGSSGRYPQAPQTRDFRSTCFDHSSCAYKYKLTQSETRSTTPPVPRMHMPCPESPKDENKCPCQRC